MHQRRNYRIAATLLILAAIAAGYSFYKLDSVGLSNPHKAQVWFGLLLGSLTVAVVAYLVFIYARTRKNQSSSEEIAMQALAAAGRNLAKAQAEQAAAKTKPKSKPKPVAR